MKRLDIDTTTTRSFKEMVESILKELRVPDGTEVVGFEVNMLSTTKVCKDNETRYIIIHQIVGSSVPNVPVNTVLAVEMTAKDVEQLQKGFVYMDESKN